MFGLVTRKEYNALAARVERLERSKRNKAPGGFSPGGVAAAKQVLDLGGTFTALSFQKEMKKIGLRYKKGSASGLLSALCRIGYAERVKFGLYKKRII